MSNRKNISRRKFVKDAVAASTAVLGFPYVISSSALGKAGTIAPSNRMTVGAIGVGEQGNGVLGNFLNQFDAQVVAVCDVDTGRRNATAAWVNSHYKTTGCTAYGDFRELLARKDIDAVSIATPDQWHVLTAIASVKSGKDVYMEKPLGRSVEEGQTLRKTVERYNAVFQFGTQQRSSDYFRKACELARSGRIGKLHTINVWAPPSVAGGSTKPAAVPKGLDYDRWLGPAPYRDYTENLCASKWADKHWWFVSDFCLGWISGWGIHPVDIALWGGKDRLTGPIEVQGKGEFPTEGLCDTATYWDVKLKYASGVTMNFLGALPSEECSKRYTKTVDHGTAFEGTEGWVHVNRSGVNSYFGSLLKIPESFRQIRLYQSNNHVRNFLDCVKSRAKTICPVDEAVQADIICQISDIAIRLGRKVTWDTKNEVFLNDAEANRMLKRPMRSPWSL